MDGSCHCGAVTIYVPTTPPYLSECNCSICRRYAAAWTYWPSEAVTVAGLTVTYAWGDKDLDFHHCPTCGCITHWSGHGRDIGRVGVNARLLDGWPFPDSEREMLDGASM